MARRLPFRGQNPQSKPPYFIHSIAFKSCSLRWARGGGRGFRLPLPTLTTSPLALSRFLRRAAAGACKNRSAAPGCRYPNMRRGSQPACIFGRRPLLRLAASAAGSARLRSQRRLPVSSTGRGRRRCPGPKRGSRSVQKPKKHSHACPWKLQRSPNGGTGVFLNGFCPPLRLLSAPALAGAGPVGKPTTTENPRLFLRSGGFIIIFQGVPRTEKQATQNLGLTRAQPGSLIKRLKPYHRLGLVKPTAVSGTR